ncbi:M48 family metalloprotease [Deinococcus sp. SDU3-2]|uniref:M48 family metalloprotease n=1 Tax=Deinococcus terrestris TaxID=2651870 RepID=A0A7X1NTB0_9DEIO|nr:M48 family metalloprotease [Deinococcus terrestris]MPY65416.1 M48 family metalloprotease [Deinococcus terrestris]
MTTLPQTAPTAPAPTAVTPEAQRDHQRLKTTRATLLPLVNVTLNLLLVGSGGAAGLREALGGGDAFLERAAFVGVYSLGLSLTFLPLSYALGYLPDRRAGLLRLSPGKWLGKWGQRTLIGDTVSAGIYLGLNTVFRAAPTAWLPGAAGVITALLGGLALAQPWLSRRLTRIEPPKDARVERIAGEVFAQAGVRLRQVSVAHVSGDTRMSNAFVQPGPRGAELILSDTLLAGADDDALRFVIAHELAHFRRRDLWRLLGWQWLSLMTMVGAAATLLGALGGWAGLQGAGDIAAIPLLAATFMVAQKALDLLGNALKRHMEYRADADALRLTGDLDAMRRVLERLGHDNLSDPNVSRLTEVLFHDHPSTARRLAAGAAVLTGRA